MYHIAKADAERIRERMKTTKNVLQYRKMEAVAMRGEGKKNGEIAAQTGFHSDMAGRFAKEYLEGGMEGLLFDGRKGGNNRNATEAETRKFLEQFEEKAEKGQIVEVSEIAAAYDKHFKKEHKSKSTVY